MLHSDKVYVYNKLYVFFQALVCCFFIQETHMKHIMQWINAPASRERKLDFQFLTDVS